MPVANCIVDLKCQFGEGDISDLWRLESGISSDEMTVNISVSHSQFGKRYSVMAMLYLPSVWSSKNISSLQLGLAKALSQYFSQPLSQVHVTTSIIESGFVVENGSEQEW